MEKLTAYYDREGTSGPRGRIPSGGLVDGR